MSRVKLHVRAALAVAERDFRIYRSYRLRAISQLLQILFTLTLFYYLSQLVRVGPFTGSHSYFAFAVVGLVILQVLTFTFSLLPGDLRQELVAGTFERVVVSPFGPLGGVISLTLFPLVISFVSGLLTVAVGAIVFGLPLAGWQALLAIPVGLLGELAFVPFALGLAGLVLCVKQAGAGAGYVVTLFSLIGGFYFPVSLLPGWIRWASDAQPFTPTVDLMRHLLVDSPLREDGALSLAKLAGSAILLLPLGVLVLRRAIEFSQRRGTIIEY